jgi:hypothetical protein
MDIAAVHSSYAKWRVPLLAHGVARSEALAAASPRASNRSQLGLEQRSSHDAAGCRCTTLGVVLLLPPLVS